MAKPTQTEIDEAIAKLAEIKKMSAQIGAGIDVSKFADVAKFIKEIDLLFESLTEKIRKAGEDTDYLVSNFASLVNSVKQFNSGISQQNAALKGLSSATLTINEHQRGYADLTLGEIKKLDVKINKNLNLLSISQKTLSAELAEARYKQSNLNKTSASYKSLSAQIYRINSSLKTGDSLLKDTNNTLSDLKVAFEKVKEEVIQIEKHLGLGGAVLEGFDGILSKFGLSGLSKSLGIQKANEEMKDLAKTIVKAKQRDKELNKELQAEIDVVQRKRKNEGKIPLTSKQLNTNFAGKDVVNKRKEIEDNAAGGYTKMNSFSVLNAGIKSMGKSLLTTVLNPLTMAVALILGAVDGFLRLNKAQTDFGRETGHTIDHFDTLNLNLLTSADYIRTATALTQQMGMDASVIFSQGTLKEASELVNLMGLSNEETGKLATFAKASGKELLKEDQTLIKQLGHFNQINRTAITGKSILQDVAKVTDTIALNFGNSITKIGAAASEAKKFGLTLSQVDKVAESLMNFETSITNELEAELLTGREFNNERARLLAINNDINGLTKEIGNNQSVLAAFASGNRLQQEAVAKIYGMQKDEIAGMIIAEKKRQGLSDEGIAKAAGMELSDYKRLSVQESINKSIEKMGEALAGPLQALAELLQHTTLLKALFLTIGSIITISLIGSTAKFVMALGRSLGPLALRLGIVQATAAGELTMLAAATIGVGTVVAMAAALAAISTLNSTVDQTRNSSSQVQDGEINASGGMVVSKFEKGRLRPIAQGIKEDNVIFTTNRVQKGQDMSVSSNQNASNASSLSETNKLLMQLINQQASSVAVDEISSGIRKLYKIN